MSMSEQINASRQYLRAGTYRALSPVITASGIVAGWTYSYPLGINRNGMRFADAGETLNSLFAQGHIELRERTRTAV